jgi:glycosyltransferase involved in cell wall biosynthesis
MNKANPNKPLVSLILPVFKSEKFLSKCLESLINQSYKNIEIVAVVDYLGDDSLKILRKYKRSDKRLRIYSNLQRYGLASTLNRCVKVSKGRYIAFMDPNGVAAHSRINKQVKFLKENEKIAAVGSQIITINEKNKSIATSLFPQATEEIYRHLIGSESMKFETVMVDRNRIPKDILKFKKNTHYPYIFVDVFMKIGQYKELANINEPLVKVREIIKDNNQIIRIDKKITFLKLLFDSTTNHEYKPSLKAIFSPILKQG